MEEIVVGDIVFLTEHAEIELRSRKLMSDSEYIIPSLSTGFRITRITRISVTGAPKERDSLYFEYIKDNRKISTWLFRHRFTKKGKTFFNDEDFLI